MLFSRADVALFINRNFESAWESVRPVPTVRIDFGNDTVVTRTLHGNIATYVCTRQGDVLDILPGIYEPSAYLKGLDQFRLLAHYVDQQGAQNRQARLRDYHQRQAEALAKNQAPDVFVNTAGVSKAGIERSIFAVLVPAQKAAAAYTLPKSPEERRRDRLNLFTPEDVASWNLLSEDTRINETARRRQIHDLLAAAGPVRPNDVVKQVYREALHTDLDDPYLGLGNVLFANYPFAREELGKR